jgi:hypothetical protein
MIARLIDDRRVLVQIDQWGAADGNRRIAPLSDALPRHKDDAVDVLV